MYIIMCADCGYIGSNKDLVDIRPDLSSNGDNKINNIVNLILHNNNFCKKSCPNCSSSNIFYRSDNKIFKKEQLIDENIISSSVDNLYKTNGKFSKVEPNRHTNTSKIFKCQCDSCGNKFDSKIKESTKCEKCFGELLV